LFGEADVIAEMANPEHNVNNCVFCCIGNADLVFEDFYEEI
jgi:hypothetical protein